MQMAAPEAIDIDQEPEHIHKLYGVGEKRCDHFARQCLVARRLVERGVRFVQIYSGGMENERSWDGHRTSRPTTRSSPAKPTRPSAACCRSQAARPSRQHARHLGRRVRPAADRAKGRHRPRPQPARLHLLAGRRRRQRRASATARPTRSATKPSRTASTSTTCTPRSCTSSASTTPTHLPLQRPRLPPDRRRRARGEGNSGVAVL